MAVKSLQDLRSTQKEAASTRRSQALWKHARHAPTLKKKRVALVIFVVFALVQGFSANADAAFFFFILSAVFAAMIGADALKAVPAHKPSSAATIVQAASAHRAERLSKLLSESDRGLTVEQLSAKLRWALHAVVDGLQAGVDAGDIAEDFDTRAGQYVYLNVERTLASGAVGADQDALALADLRRFDEALNAAPSQEEAEVEVAARARPQSKTRAR
jgi:2C-methyl-D-erythritol 2,4-cyclodiphosphate synthase